MKLLGIEHIDEANAITHGGVFHADEVLATAILDLAIVDLKVCRVARVSLAPIDAIVYDIGGGAFDHHQRGGNGKRVNGVPYASAGLIWRAYGMRVVEDLTDPEKAWNLIDRNLIQGVDAADNGLTSVDESAGQPSFSQIVSLLNPAAGSTQEDVTNAFCEAVKLAELVLEKMIKRIGVRLSSTPIVEKAIECSKDHILVLPHHVPWDEALHKSENRNANEVFFVVYPSAREGYCWQCVPTSAGGKDQRLQIPESWRGLSGGELQKASGVEDALFCHASGFLGVAKTKSGALSMLRIAMAARGIEESRKLRSKNLLNNQIQGDFLVQGDEHAVFFATTGGEAQKTSPKLIGRGQACCK